MTAAATAASQSRQAGSKAAAVPWRQLVRVTVRQHRTALLWTGVVVVLMAVALVATGIPLYHYAARLGPNWYGRTRGSVDYGGVLRVFEAIFQVAPLFAGMFLGAPLLPREIDHGTAKLAWTQAASRTRWLLGQVLPFASLMVLAAVGLGALLAWWHAPFPHFQSEVVGPWSVWSPWQFNLNPVLLAGWVVFAFTLGVFLGAAIRRTVPAMAATFGCVGALFYAVSVSWRMHYLPPLHRAQAVHFQGGGSFYSYGVSWGGRFGGQPVVMSQALGWPDGRLLSNADQLRPTAWLNLHHIVLWVTYQPDSRYHAFQLIELGWLLIAAALLLAGAIALTRRRPA